MKSWTTLPAILLSLSLQAHTENEHAKDAHVEYVRNLGQWPAQVQYRSDFSGASMFLEQNCVTWVRLEEGAGDKVHELTNKPGYDLSTLTLQAHAWKVHFVGGDPAAAMEAEEKQTAYYNYFLGNDPAHWASNVPVFNGVTYGDLWPGIDVRWHGEGIQVKYDVMVDAGADASLIAFRYEGLDGLSVDRDGDLLLRTSVGELTEMRPIAWYADDRSPLTCSYVVKNGEVRFAFPKGLDKGRAVVIDPLLMGATYTGVVGNDIYGHCATYDTDGNMYSGGQSFGPGYPTTPGAFQAGFGGGFGTDIAVNKYTPDATGLIWATYIGGSADEKPHSMITTAAQELTVLGSSTGAGYPCSTGCYDNSFNGGGSDIVITRLNATGTALIGSTYIGGSSDDGRQIFNMYINYGDTYRGEVMLDAAENTFIASFAQSANFPTTAGAYQTALAGGQDGVVLGVTPNCSALIWSTFIGGTSDDNALGLRFTAAGDLYVCGGTRSSNFPMAGGGWLNTYQGGDKDGYIVKFSGAGSTLAYSTFFGTAGEDVANFIDLDNDEDVYIYGQSDGGVAITPPGIYGTPGGNIFLAEFDPALATTTFTTAVGPLGGFGYSLAPVAFLVDVCEHIYISGYNPNGTWQTTPDALYGPGFSQFYLAAYDVNMAGILFGTYYGGSHVDGGTSRFDKNGIIYQGVCSGGSSMPTTPGAYAPINMVGWDVGTFKIDFQVAGVNAAAASSIGSGCAPLNIDFTNTSTGTNWLWDFGDGSATTTVYSPSHLYTTPGAFTVTLIAMDSLACNLADTTYLTVTIGAATPIVAAFTAVQNTDCSLSQVITTNGSTGAPLSFEWDMGDGSAILTDTNVVYNYAAPGTYDIELVVYDPTGCSQPDSVTQTINILPPITVDAAFTVEQVPDCALLIVSTDNLSIAPGTPTYLWDMGDGTTYTTEDVTHTYTAPGLYTIWLWTSDPSTCNLIDSLSLQVQVDPAEPVSASFTIDQAFDCATMVGQTNNTSTGSFLLFWWDMGDGTTATTEDVTHTYTAPGTYDITLIVSDSLGCSPSDTATAQVTIDPLVPVVADFTLSQIGSCLMLTVEGVNLSTGDSVSYSWDMGDGTILTTTDVNYVYAVPGTYTITLTVTDLGCGQDDDMSMTVEVINELPTPLVSDAVVCFGQTVTLDATNPDVDNYLWSNGATTPTITVASGGTYIVEVYTAECYGTDTVEVVEGTDPELSYELDACPEEHLDLSVPMDGQSYSWSTGGDEQTEHVIGDGTYIFTVVDFLGCSHTDTVIVHPLDSDAILFAPNAFTPDGDGINDVFTIAGFGEERTELTIFDRWGEQLYASTDLNKPWDGKYSGELVKQDVYVYTLKYNAHCDQGNEKLVYGHVSVLH